MSNKLSTLRKELEFFVSPAAAAAPTPAAGFMRARELSVAGTNMPPVRSTVDTVVGIR